MMYLLHSIQDSEDQRGDKKENNMVRFRVPTSSEITRQKERAKERERASKSELRASKSKRKRVIAGKKRQANLLVGFRLKGVVVPL